MCGRTGHLYLTILSDFFKKNTYFLEQILTHFIETYRSETYFQNTF
jgi:hypothetical protein